MQVLSALVVKNNVLICQTILLCDCNMFTCISVIVLSSCTYVHVFGVNIEKTPVVVTAVIPFNCVACVLDK